MTCLDPDYCNSGKFPLCSVCQEKLEDLAIKSALNMGTPEVVGCGTCGEWFIAKNFFVHSCVKNASS